MEDETKNTKEISDNLKAELSALLRLNKKRKSALEKMSKSFLEEENKTEEQKHSERKKM